MGWLSVVLGLFGFGGSYVVPLDHAAIEYAKRPVSDSVSKINGARFEWSDDGTGYLISVLKTLDVPVESQLLVFSKTSFQASRIAPATPRALYFNDRVSIGFVRGGDVLEVAAIDPKQGTIFYTLDQDPTVQPRFERRDTACLQCHQSGATVGVPGIMVRSVFPERSGMPLFQAGTFNIDHRTPVKQRWGGWFVTGSPNDPHMGNRIVPDRNAPEKLDAPAPRFDTGAYLSPHSDVIALMTFEHQAHMTNLLTRLGWETRMALLTQAEMNRILNRPENELSESAERRISSGVEEVLAYMTFEAEAPFSESISGDSGFTEKFAARGPRDSKGRSLRDFDLKTRLFKYPVSYMIYSETFASLPDQARDRLLRALYTRLKKSPETVAILRETLPNPPAWWR